MEDPFALLDEALALSREHEPPTENYHVAYLPCGDVHVCRGSSCPFLELNEDKCYVCSLSGFCFGAQSIREDYSTGRQAGSSNPDDHAGEPVGGQWRQKKDMFSMSSQAYVGANALTEETGTPKGPATEATSPNHWLKGKESPRPAKRGARCVDEPQPDPQQQQKRCRHNRRAANTQEQFRALQQDAENTLCKLVNFDKRDDSKVNKPRDPRLLDKNVLFQAAMKKYTKECLASGTVPTLDALHNLALAAANVAAEEKRKATLETGKQALLLKVRMREQVTSLAVSLWQASAKTPYMQGSRRGADSFRPFVCGVLYALKRGVDLPDGTVVVPACPDLAAALPALRSTAANSTAKALHASSHRGLCTLHRSISSCSSEIAAELFRNSAQLAQQLTASVHQRNFDLC